MIREVMNTLPTELGWILASILAFCAVFCCYISYGCMRRCRFCVEVVKRQNKNAVTLRKLSEIEVEMTDLADSIAALHDGHKKLRSRIGMRLVREQRKEDQEPDPIKNPDEYKRHMRQKLGLNVHRGK